jgi:hypothetical protein
LEPILEFILFGPLIRSYFTQVLAINEYQINEFQKEFDKVKNNEL